MENCSAGLVLLERRHLRSRGGFSDLGIGLALLLGVAVALPTVAVALAVLVVVAVGALGVAAEEETNRTGNGRNADNAPDANHGMC